VDIDEHLITVDCINLGDFINYSFQGTFNPVIDMDPMNLVFFAFTLQTTQVNTQETAKQTR
jgi:hypothetical protein